MFQTVANGFTLWPWFNTIPVHMRLLVNEVVLEQLFYTRTATFPLYSCFFHAHLCIGAMCTPNS